MLSVANVRTAGGAARYFAADNYYTRADADRSGAWFGKGAERQGLAGEVDPKVFEAVLRGLLPDGTRVGNDKREHRAGTDLTFSMPKSWSLLALVGGDKRILEAYSAAVKETLAWAERNLAETRMEVKGKERVVQTGNLVVALFQHDTNRNQEPNAHIHAVVANVTQGPDGKWRALRNDKLWEHNTLLNAMTMARFRLSVERMGYEVGPVAKHGNFEAVGVPREVIEAFSSRRAEIVEALGDMASRGLNARSAANLMTRSAKATIEDRAALAAGWKDKADSLNFDPTLLIARANARAAGDLGAVPGLGGLAGQMIDRARDLAARLAERLGLRSGDPLMPADLARRSPTEVAAAHAVASAIRHLAEREAAFPRTAIYKAALDFGLPTAMPEIERRVAQLERKGELQRGKGAERGLVTTAAAIQTEQRIVAAIEEGRGRASSIVPSDEAGARLQGLSQLKYGMTLNDGQEAAGRLLLSSHNRIVAIQGVAGAGKSTMLRPAADVLREEGRKVLGLAVQNTLVQMLERETGIEAMTVARFLTREELRYASTYQTGQVVEVDRDKRAQGLKRGNYKVVGIDAKRERVTLENERGKRFEFMPGRLRPQGEHDPLRLFEVRNVELHAGDRIRWTETDHKRGLLNADQARITAIEPASVWLKTSLGIEHELARDDPMLRRLDLAYALNAHMAQGLTSDRGIAVMDSRERNLSNQQTFLVTITRLRDGLTLFVNNVARLESAIERNTGMKRSALETVGRLREAAAAGQAKGEAARNAPAAEREVPERDRSIIKPFEIGI